MISLPSVCTLHTDIEISSIVDSKLLSFFIYNYYDIISNLVDRIKNLIFSLNLYDILEKKDDHVIIPTDSCYDSKYQGITKDQLNRNFNASPRNMFKIYSFAKK